MSGISSYSLKVLAFFYASEALDLAHPILVMEGGGIPNLRGGVMKRKPRRHARNRSGGTKPAGGSTSSYQLLSMPNVANQTRNI